MAGITAEVLFAALGDRPARRSPTSEGATPSEDFAAFLNKVNREVPDGLELQSRFNPTYGSRMNLVER